MICYKNIIKILKNVIFQHIYIYIYIWSIIWSIYIPTYTFLMNSGKWLLLVYEEIEPFRRIALK